MLKRLSIGVMSVGLFAVGGQAQIIDVLANPGAGGNVFNVATDSDSDYYVVTNDANDNLWSPVGGNALASFTNSNEDSPQLYQTFNGLDDTRIYNIYIKGDFYWNQSLIPGLYYAPAGNIAGEALKTYLDDDGLAPTGAIEEVYLLVGQVSGVSSVTVNYDDFDNAAVDAFTGSPKRNNRTYIQGFAYEDIGPVPEPASLALLAAGLGVIGLRRSRS